VKHFYEISELGQHRQQLSKLYLEFLRVPSMSAGVYVLSPDATDPQTLHNEDELYYVVRGCARMRIGTEERKVSAGSVIFVEAHQPHQFYDVIEELVVLVFFAPAET
jgi:mannose-6-phosphate isomerase-like protein (cupin superfamily)